MNQEIHYIVYKTTNLINGKYYIGLHRTADLDDGYIGSGKLLKRAFRKYGKENFICEHMYVFDNERQMTITERVLVVPDDETNYNLVPGGYGGWNKNIPMNDASKENLRRLNIGKKHSEDAKRKIAESKKGRKRAPFSEETKLKMSLAQSARRKRILAKDEQGAHT